MGPFSSPSDRNSAAAAAAAAASATATSISQSKPPSATASDDNSTSKKFLKRLNLLPLRSRTRNIADFHIRPDDPHRKYSAGDHVQGAVVLTVIKPVRITHLTVLLHGYVRVYKGPGAQNNDPVRSPAEIVSSRGERKKYWNGYVPLFQDEQVLSSDGRLEPGRYEFNFDLLFPASGLPSSIDFERGTISYMITATLTRPTSVSPTTSCERKIYLTEKLDVGPLAPPKAQTVDLRPISKRSKKKRPAGDRRSVISSERSSADVPEPLSDGESARINDTSTEGSLSVIGDDVGQEREREAFSHPPRSVSHSEMRSLSGDSAASLSTHPSRAHSETNQLAIVGSTTTGKRISFADERTIKLTVEVLKGGCLPGDVIPIKVSVQHIKRIKSMHGVIVTLFRQGRIDTSPPPLFKEDLKRAGPNDDYYPKSRTGLSGLSLSSAGSCSMFRKDLSQAFAPLITDPLSFSATLTTSVRVPEDSFPTIKGVPGEMISFKYYVEVIVDLGGKLANHLQSGASSGSRVGATGVVGNPFESMSALPSWGATGSSSILDTDRLKRIQGVIPGYYEVIVGTTDSNRLRGKGPQRPSLTTQTPPATGGPGYVENEYNEKGGWPNSMRDDNGYGPESANPDGDYASYPPTTTHPLDYVHQPSYWNYVPDSSQHEQEIPAPHYIPPPDLPDENSLPEKERIRRAEQRLLPSQPPIAAASSSSSVPIPSLFVPNHPMDSSLLLNGDNIYDAEDDVPTPAATPATAPPFDHDLAPEYTPTPAEDLPSAPTLEELDHPPPISRGASHHPLSATEDKQELERRRLLAEASAPPEFPEDYIPDEGGGPVTPAGPSSAGAGPSAPPSAPSVAYEPSAPVFFEDDEDYHGGGGGPSSTHHVAPGYGPGHEDETMPEYTYTYNHNHRSGSVGTVTVAGGPPPPQAVSSSGHAHDPLREHEQSQQQQARSDSSSPPPIEYLPRYER